MLVKFNCLHCNKFISGNRHKLKPNRKFCSKKCSFEYHKKEKCNLWKGGLLERKCQYCDKIFKIYPYNKKAKYCSHKCNSLSSIGRKQTVESVKKRALSTTGEKNWQWNGGKYHTSSGYVLILKPNHPFSNNQGYIREHRIVAEKYLNRYLEKTELVHHINGIKDDNRPENLYLFSSNKEHIHFHDYPYQLTSNII